MPKKLKTVFEEFQGAANCQPRTREVIEMFKECSKQFSTVVVLLDAFDECAATEQKGIIDLLNELGGGGIRVFVTSRPELKHALENKLIDPISAAIRAQDEDIKMYLSKRLDENGEVDPGLKKSIIEELQKEADGM
jgi:phosphoglycolate phosphatase-like HAD superfamily hydrolase